MENDTRDEPTRKTTHGTADEHTTDLDDEFDWAALDARIAGFTTQNSYSAHTLSRLKKLWRHWVEHCEDLGCDPRAASWAVWQELSNRRRLDGRRYNNPYLLEAVLWAVRWRYDLEGIDVTPAPCEPGRAADWAAVTRAFRRERAVAAAAGELDYIARTPMLRADVARMLNLPPESIPFQTLRGAPRDPAAYRAELLLALETGWGGGQLLRLRTRDFHLSSDGSVVVGDHVVPCDHRERVRGVPWDCAACAITSTLAGRGPEESFVTSQAQTFYVRLRAAAARWRHLEDPVGANDAPLVEEEDRPRRFGKPATTLRLRPGLSNAQVAGTRRGLVVVDAINSKNSAWLLGRAWLGISWEAGFRMASDLAHLPRRAVTALADGSGLVIRLAGTKDDPAGTKSVTRVFRYQDGPCAAQALAEYLTIRDAAVGTDPEGPLLITGKGTIFGPRWRDGITKPVQVANAAITQLVQAAGIDTHFTSYSTRKGFATQMAKDGRDVTHIQRGLRHARPDTTLRYLQESASDVAAKFADRLTRNNPGASPALGTAREASSTVDPDAEEAS